MKSDLGSTVFLPGATPASVQPEDSVRNAAHLLGSLQIKKVEDHAVDERSNCGRGGIRATSQTPMTQTFRLGWVAN